MPSDGERHPHTNTSTVEPVDWRTVPVPARLAGRPRDRRGLVIPFSIDDGTDHPDFRIAGDREKVRDLVRTERCWLCGQDRTYWMCFLGGPLSMANRRFADGWMHEECAVYALNVCPFIANPHGRYTTPDSGPHIVAGMAPNRPERFGLGYTRSFEFGLEPRTRQPSMHSAPFKRIRWFDAWGHEVAADG